MQGFDEESGDARQPVEVLQWPYHDLLVREGFTKAHSRRWECSSLLILTHDVRNAKLRLQLWGEWSLKIFASSWERQCHGWLHPKPYLRECKTY